MPVASVSASATASLRLDGKQSFVVFIFALLFLWFITSRVVVVRAQAFPSIAVRVVNKSVKPDFVLTPETCPADFDITPILEESDYHVQYEIGTPRAEAGFGGNFRQLLTDIQDRINIDHVSKQFMDLQVKYADVLDVPVVTVQVPLLGNVNVSRYLYDLIMSSTDKQIRSNTTTFMNALVVAAERVKFSFNKSMAIFDFAGSVEWFFVRWAYIFAMLFAVRGFVFIFGAPTNKIESIPTMIWLVAGEIANKMLGYCVILAISSNAFGAITYALFLLPNGLFVLQAQCATEFVLTVLSPNMTLYTSIVGDFIRYCFITHSFIQLYKERSAEALYRLAFTFVTAITLSLSSFGVVDMTPPIDYMFYLMLVCMALQFIAGKEAEGKFTGAILSTPIEFDLNGEIPRLGNANRSAIFYQCMWPAFIRSNLSAWLPLAVRFAAADVLFPAAKSGAWNETVDSNVRDVRSAIPSRFQRVNQLAPRARPYADYKREKIMSSSTLLDADNLRNYVVAIFTPTWNLVGSGFITRDNKFYTSSHVFDETLDLWSQHHFVKAGSTAYELTPPTNPKIIGGNIEASISPADQQTTKRSPFRIVSVETEIKSVEIFAMGFNKNSRVKPVMTRSAESKDLQIIEFISSGLCLGAPDSTGRVKHTASTTEGFSGCPVFTATGEVYGIHYGAGLFANIALRLGAKDPETTDVRGEDENPRESISPDTDNEEDEENVVDEEESEDEAPQTESVAQPTSSRLVIEVDPRSSTMEQRMTVLMHKMFEERMRQFQPKTETVTKDKVKTAPVKNKKQAKSKSSESKDQDNAKASTSDSDSKKKGKGKEVVKTPAKRIRRKNSGKETAADQSSHDAREDVAVMYDPSEYEKPGAWAKLMEDEDNFYADFNSRWEQHAEQQAVPKKMPQVMPAAVMNRCIDERDYCAALLAMYKKTPKDKLKQITFAQALLNVGNSFDKLPADKQIPFLQDIVRDQKSGLARKCFATRRLESANADPKNL